MKTDYRDFLRLMFDLIDAGMLEFPTLIWGLECCLRQLRQNDFSHVHNYLKSLQDEIDDTLRMKFAGQGNLKQQVNYGIVLVRARETIEFWYQIFKVFHDKEKLKYAKPRLLPLSRKLVIFGEDSRIKRTKFTTNYKKCSRCKKRNSN